MDGAGLAVALAEKLSHNQKDSIKISKETILFPHRKSER
jgi:hypothetical protein